MSTFIRDAQVITMDPVTGSEPVTRSIRIDDRGVITAVGTGLVPEPGEEVIAGTDRLVTPGFVNAHTHSWETLYKGRYDNLPLELWMLFTYPILGADPLPAELVRLRSLVFALESMKSGVTTLVDDVLETPSQDLDQLAAVFSAYADIGVRANVSGHVINRPFVDTIPYVADLLPRDLVAQVRGQSLWTGAEYLDYSRQAFGRFHASADGRLRYMLAPSGPQRCTEDLLVGATALAREYDAECHIHVLETKTQAVTGEQFYGRTLVQYLAELGALSRNTTFAHGIWLTEADIEVVADAGVSVSHNAISNLKLGSGIAPWRAYLDAGVTLGLGTDGWSSSDTPRLHEVMKVAALLHKVTEPDHRRWPTVDEVLRAATIGGARTAVLDGVTGSVEVGKQADLLVWDLATLNFTPRQRLDHQLVYSENGSSLEYVMVAGRVTVDHGRLMTMDEDAILAEFNAMLPSVRAWQNRTDALAGTFLPAFTQAYEMCAHADVGLNRWSAPVRGRVPDDRGLQPAR
ncbi:amidohydrolase family protein [Occultella aeris]|uniref:Atrazine chlorohydrolase n=1 Tax=Occultella aeris TaxID=2761496 RepID=A0A7M4DSJ0_9MICO|nr:amidohydrolase [Occultella aeris]VZO40434.1 Atrazine chlorohydrolase [Occultella aeris]